MCKQFGDRLKELRSEKKLTQEELAKKFNTGKASISHYESNRRLPDARAIGAFADFFDVSIDYIMGKSDIKNPHIPEEYLKKHDVTRRDKNQYEHFMEEVQVFFMNDEVAEEDKEALFRDISNLFWESKEINKEKFNPHKNKKDTKEES